MEWTRPFLPASNRAKHESDLMLKGGSMNELNVIGIDLAKNIFQLHCSSRAGKTLWKKKLKRDQLALFMVNTPRSCVVMEACGGANYWARKFTLMGHDVKLIAAQFVKPFVKSNKNDANDAEAIVEAASRPNMRFVPVKAIEQQDTLSLHRIRERLIKNRTALSNEIRGLLTEYGIVFAVGIHKIREHLPKAIEDGANELTNASRRQFQDLYEELCFIDQRVEKLESEIVRIAKESEPCQKIMKLPGIGPLTATALTATISNPHLFKNGRHLSAYLGLVPRQHSSGGKEKLLGISKRGDAYLRKLLIHGARSILLRIKTTKSESAQTDWLRKLNDRQGFNKTCVALANKNARVIWRLLATDETYRAA